MKMNWFSICILLGATVSLVGHSSAATPGVYHVDDRMDAFGFIDVLTPDSHGAAGWTPIADTFDGTVLIRFTYTPVRVGEQTFANYWSYLLLRNAANNIVFRVGSDHGTDVFVAPLAGDILRHEGFPVAFEERAFEIQIVFDYVAGGADSAVVIIDDKVFPLAERSYGFASMQVVAAHDTGGPGAHFTDISVEVRSEGLGTPAAPTGLTAKGGEGHIALRWNAVAGADGYHVKRGIAGGGHETIATVESPGYEDSEVSEAFVYEYIVSAYSDEFGEGPDSPAATASPLPGTRRWAGLEVDGEGVAHTGDWLGRVHVLEGGWVYVEDYSHYFYAYPVDLGGAWLYSGDALSLDSEFQETVTWLGTVYHGHDNHLYSYLLEKWFFPVWGENAEGVWLYAHRRYPSIPEERIVAWDPGVRGGIPHYPVAIELERDALPDGEEANAAPVIQAAVNAVAASGEFGAVLLPEGTFRLTETIHMRSGVVLRGQGLDKTRLIMDNPGSSWSGIVGFTGSHPTGERGILDGYVAGSDTLRLASTQGLYPGRMVVLESDNDLDAMYGNNQSWREAGMTWARRTVGQVVEITEVNGDTVVIDTPARLSRMHLNPTLRHMGMIENAGVEALHMSWESDADDFNVIFSRAMNCWVLDCELEFTGNSHVHIAFSRYVTIESNYIHHAHRYGGGGSAYGVALGHASSDNLIWNNVFRVLRHAMLTGGGANGNVWAYNHSQEQTQQGGGWGADISVHGHYPYMELYEGNRAEYAMSTDYWGAAGPLVTFFRNRLDPSTHSTGAPGSLRIQYASHYQNAIANSLVVGQSLIVAGDCEEPYVEGNLIQGNIVWNDTDPFPMRPSLFLSSPPHFWGDTPWPAIGADVDFRAINAGAEFHRIPAQVWAERILDEGRALPFQEAMAD